MAGTTKKPKKAAPKKAAPKQTNSLVDWLKANGMDSDFDTRGGMYEAMFGDAYKGTAAQNMRMLEQIKKQDAEWDARNAQPQPQQYAPQAGDFYQSMQRNQPFYNDPSAMALNAVGSYRGYAPQQLPSPQNYGEEMVDQYYAQPQRPPQMEDYSHMQSAAPAPQEYIDRYPEPAPSYPRAPRPAFATEPYVPRHADHVLEYMNKTPYRAQEQQSKYLHDQIIAWRKANAKRLDENDYSAMKGRVMDWSNTK